MHRHVSAHAHPCACVYTDIQTDIHEIHTSPIHARHMTAGNESGCVTSALMPGAASGARSTADLIAREKGACDVSYLPAMVLALQDVARALLRAARRLSSEVRLTVVLQFHDALLENCVQVYIELKGILEVSIAYRMRCPYMHIPHAYAYVHTCTCICTRAHIHARIHTYIHTYIHACIHTHTHTYIHT
jgi:hypothetical protein